MVDNFQRLNLDFLSCVKSTRPTSLVVRLRQRAAKHDSKTGELRPSQHLGLARLASRQFDRVERLSLPEDHPRRLSFRRGEALGQGCGLQHDSISFHEWLNRQGIETGNGNGEEAAPRRGARARRRAEAGVAAGAGLVVAYWSYDYRDHAMGHLTRGLFCSHQVNEFFLLNGVG